MDIRQLRGFLVVAEEANFGRAAERINLSQPALSRQIKSLEEEIGFELFDRSAKAIRLTDAGRTYEADVRQMLRDLDEAGRLGREIANGQSGHLRIGIFGSAILDFIPEVVSRFRKAAPNVRISLRLLDKDLQIEALRRGQLDIGFNRLVPEEPDIMVERVRSEPLLFATRIDNPLARRHEVAIEDILDEPLILYPSGVRNSLVNKVHALFEQVGAAPRVAQDVPDPTTALALVAGGMGSAIMPRAVSRLRLPDIRFLPFRAAGAAHINLACLYMREHRPPALESLLDMIRALAREEESANPHVYD